MSTIMERQVRQLLQVPPDTDVAAYFHTILEQLKGGVEVRLDSGEKRGKGLFTTQSYKQGDSIFSERPLVESAVGEGGQRLSALLDGSLKLPQSEKFILPPMVPCRGGCDECYCSGECERLAWEQQHCLLCPAAPGAVAEVQRAVLSSLAGSRQSAGKGKGKAAKAAPQKPSPDSTGASSSSAAAAGAGASGSSGPLPAAPPPPPSLLHGVHIDRELLRDFYQHAEDTNEIFVVAAKLIAGIIIVADRELQQPQGAARPEPAAELPGVAAAVVQSAAAQAPGAGAVEAATPAPAGAVHGAALAAAAVGGPAAAAAQGRGGAAGSSSHQPAVVGADTDACWLALQRAWRPYSMAHKAVWWEAVAVPEDVEDEAEFRGQLRELAEDSLALLQAALGDHRFPALFDLQVYGSIIGMFELNNLNLSIPSPLEDFFLLLADLPQEQRRSPGARAAQLLLDALDSDYDSPAEGTGFFALQSCANHSCAPSAQAYGEAEGCITLAATDDLAAGAEVTISYIDECAPRAERQLALRDYGFVCGCSRCAAGTSSSDDGVSGSGSEDESASRDGK